MFKLHSEYKPTGDQPQAIEKLVKGIKEGKIYEEINQLEKTEIETVVYARYAELFYPWLLTGALLIFLELLLANTRFVRIP